MRLSDNHVLQMVTEDRYVLVEDSSGAEMVLDSETLARLAVGGVGYFQTCDPSLADAVTAVRANNPGRPVL